MDPTESSEQPTPKDDDDEFQQHPELLMAACRGDWSQLNDLLAKEEEDAPEAGHEAVVRVDEAVDRSAAVAAEAAVTMAQDSVLHVVASRGDGESFLKSATVIVHRGRAAARHLLLGAGNRNGDTPLHLAARGGCGRMVSHLVALAGDVAGGDRAVVEAILRKQNKQGETVLHEAVRLGDGGMVGRLMSDDWQLARVPLADGTSALYLAVSLGLTDIARQLYKECREPPSWSGPDGQNALHAAVLEGVGATKMLLGWNRDLTKQGERLTRSTPLHLAASWGRCDVMSLLLEADESAAFQADKNGSFPIHAAASANRVKAVSLLLRFHHGCAELRDGNGMTFLHVAVLKESKSVVTYACHQGRMFASSFMNMQDDDGNTALHFAVQVGNLWIFKCIMKNRLVKLNLENNKRQTPVDVSWISAPRGVYFVLNERIRIFFLLRHAGAQYGTYRLDLFREEHFPRLDQNKEEGKITGYTQIIGMGLIATATFAAAVAVPGGYRGDGMPTLAEYYAFEVFIIANTLAFVCSCLSLLGIMYSGIGSTDVRTGMNFILFSARFMGSSARSLAVAFASGLYVVLAPAAHTTAIASSMITALALVDIVWFIWAWSSDKLLLLKRLGVRAWWRLPRVVLASLMWHCWQYVVIAGVVAYSEIKRVH